MLSKTSSTPSVDTLLTGLAMGESPRWHGNRLWFCDWGSREVLTVERKGDREVVLRTEFELPFCIDWLPDHVSSIGIKTRPPSDSAEKTRSASISLSILSVR
jgi:sugar lactone lactonase YvrE